MKSGRYGPGNTDFSKLKVGKFPVHLFNKADFSNYGCGPNTLALLTGVNPSGIKGKNHASDRFMVDFLRKHGWSVYEVNKANLTRSKKIEFPITDQHILLVSILMRRAEASWAVINNSLMFHNFDVAKVNLFEIFNWQPLSAYVIFKEELAINSV